MKKQILSTLVATALVSVSTSAMAAQIDGIVNADNRFTVAITQNGNIVSRYDAPSNYDWRTKQRFSLQTPENLKQCRVNVIVWGDNAVGEGFAGVLKGNKGQIYTGGTGAQGFERAVQSTMLSGGSASLPTTGEVISMAGQNGPTPSVISSPVWGAASGYYTGSDFSNGAVPSNFNWIKPQGAGKTTNRHWVYSTSCGNLVKPEMPAPIDVSGDHFQCYMLKKGDNVKEQTLMIEDQFGKSEAVLGRPVMLCNPSSKLHNRKNYGVRNKERHLVCYNYAKRQKPISEDLMINNQMGSDKVVATKDELFCVPSHKYHLDKEGNVIDNGAKTKRPPPRSIRVQPRQQRR